MTDRESYYKLDDIGFVGQQKKQTPASRKYHKKKTGEMLRKARAAASPEKTAIKKIYQ